MDVALGIRWRRGAHSGFFIDAFQLSSGLGFRRTWVEGVCSGWLFSRCFDPLIQSLHHLFLQFDGGFFLCVYGGSGRTGLSIPTPGREVRRNDSVPHCQPSAPPRGGGSWGVRGWGWGFGGWWLVVGGRLLNRGVS